MGHTQHLTKFECMISGMPHILDYCATSSLVSLSRTSTSTHLTTKPLIDEKFNAIPITIQIDDAVIDTKTSMVMYDCIHGIMSITCSFTSPLYKSPESFHDPIFFHIFTPYDIWGYHESLGSHKPNIMWNAVSRCDGGIPTTSYLDIYDVGNTRMRLLCDYDKGYFHITGIGIQYETAPVYKFPAFALVGLIWFLATTALFCGLIIGCVSTVVLYKCVIVCNAYDSVYREKRRKDW